MESRGVTLITGIKFLYSGDISEDGIDAIEFDDDQTLTGGGTANLVLR